MAKERILIVEDERIVAEDLRSMLQDMGYTPVGMASSAEEAIQKATDLKPDLVLMDIRLNGSKDGIDAAEQIWVEHEIPVTYLTAYADEHTLERAKATLPFGYILKPFDEKDLRATIEIALYKKNMDSTLSQIDNWPSSALAGLGYAVVVTDPKGRVTYMNDAAESLSGRRIGQVYGVAFSETFQFRQPNRNQERPIEHILYDHPNSSQDTAAVLIGADGRDVIVDYRTTQLKDRDGVVTGNVVIFHDRADTKQKENV